MKTSTHLVLAVSFTLIAYQSWAAISISYRENIGFSKKDLFKGTRWSRHWSSSEKGLLLSNPIAPQTPPWIEIGPISAQSPLRPPNAFSLTVEFGGKQPHGFPARLFARYSADGRHWTAWKEIKAKPLEHPEYGGPAFSGSLSVPSAEHELYSSLRTQWMKENPNRYPDDWVFCAWLKSTQPDFFNKHIPFIGYLALKLEGTNAPIESVLIEKARVDISWLEGGSLANLPRADPSVRKYRTEPRWHFPADNMWEKIK